MNKTLEEVCKMILHIKHPEIYKSLGISPPRGLLLHGPPGCGKTLLANAIAGELDVPLIKVAAPELVAGVSGESEERIRELFAEATKAAPCVLFIDEIDAITPSRQNVQKDMEKRIVAQMLSCLDDLNENGDSVLVIGASNRLDSIDAALRRAGRFDKEISLGIPDVHSRSQILKNFCANLKLTENFDFDTLAGYTPGFVGADLLSLTREAAMVAVNRCFKELQNQRESQEVENQKDQPAEERNNDSMEEINVSFNATEDAENTEREKDKSESTSARVTQHTTLEELLEWLHKDDTFSDSRLCDLCITMSDFEEALKHIQPSAKREGFATVPNTTWDDIGSLRDIREELEMAIVAPVRHAKEFSELGIDIPTGVLLCGPPGCGKTLLAKAIANEAGINFISVKGPELLNMYVGESEKAVRVCFERARNSAPCVIFFDELDALCPKRSDSGEGSACRVVNQMLTEMDGVEGRRGVYLLAASNRPDIIDPAVLRPGGWIRYCSSDCRLQRINGTVPKLAPDVNLEDIGKREQCEGYTGSGSGRLGSRS
ncbi:hypothetical protein NQ318_000143 [Aromia moschata]|uniref:AAA+ ATPase domain-containing protein n=1 Tax=Aromia moschata TaxID=1265417 RepID=A0AAV8XH57_9CUCU|nr:hypothetical protein NQ318_000143 [Aromia moschata]